MLEIGLVIVIVRAIGGALAKKHRPKIGWQMLGVLMWLAGEMLTFYGCRAAGIGPDQLSSAALWRIALLGGAVGGGAVYLFALALPPATLLAGE